MKNKYLIRDESLFSCLLFLALGVGLSGILSYFVDSILCMSPIIISFAIYIKWNFYSKKDLNCDNREKENKNE